MLKSLLRILPLLLILIGLTIYFVFLPSRASIGLSQWGVNVPVSDSFTNPSVASNDVRAMIPTSNDSVITLWQDDKDGNGRNIYAQKINSTSIYQWDVEGVKVSNVNNGNSVNLQGSDRDSSGSIFISWSVSSGINYEEIFAQKINSNGSVLWGNGVAVSSESTQQDKVKIINDGQGGAYVSFLDVDTSKIKLQRLSSSGNKLWIDEGIRISSSLNAQESQYQVISASSSIVIAWIDYDPNDGGVFMQKFNNNGDKLWGEEGVRIGNGLSDINNKIYLSEVSGGFVVVWENTYQSSIYVQKVNQLGQIQLSSGGVIFNNSASSINAVTSNPNEVLISWFDIVTGATLINKINLSGNKIWAQDVELVNSQGRAKIVGDGGTGFYAVIDRYNINPTETKAYRFNSAGQSIWTEGKVLSDGSSYNRTFGAYKSDYNNLFVIMATCADSSCNQFTNVLSNLIYQGNQIHNTLSTVDIVDIDDLNIELGTSYGKSYPDTIIRIKDTDNNWIIAEANVDMTVERSWPDVDGDSDFENGKSLIKNLVSAPGADDSYTLFIPKLGNHNSVRVCPDATILDEVNSSCTNGYGISNPVVESINGQEYFKIIATDDYGAMGIEAYGPTITLLSITNINEGTTAKLVLNFSDPDEDDTHTVIINWGDGNTNTYNLAAGELVLNESHFYNNNPETSQFTIHVTLKDSTDMTESISTVVTVGNIAPTLNNMQILGTEFVKNISGNIIDPGVMDPMILQINWGDGTANSNLNLAAGSTAFTITHVYADYGSYNVSLRITDDAGAFNVYSLVINIIRPVTTTPNIGNNNPQTLLPDIDSPGLVPEVEGIGISNPSKNTGILNTNPIFDWDDASAEGVVQYKVYVVKIKNEFGIELTYPREFTTAEYLRGVIDDPKVTELTLSQQFLEGTYLWVVVGLNINGEVIGQSDPVEFTIQKNTQVQSNPITSSGSFTPLFDLSINWLLGFIFVVIIITAVYYYIRRKQKEKSGENIDNTKYINLNNYK